MLRQKITRILLIVIFVPFIKSQDDLSAVECLYYRQMCHQMLPSFNSSPTKWFNHGPKLCEAMFKCESNSEVDTIKTNIYDNITISRQPRSPNTRGLLFGRPVRKPKDSYKRRECRKCERKRAGCTRFYLFTYGVCGGAYIAGPHDSDNCAPANRRHHITYGNAGSGLKAPGDIGRKCV